MPPKGEINQKRNPNAAVKALKILLFRKTK